MKTILFVDDEPRIIHGLKRMLRSFRKEWEMKFAFSGAEALEILEMYDVDVVISDMRMPGMDGAELLEKVMERHPNVVRIILSGQSNKEMILKSVKPAHQFLSKPCDADTIKNTIQKALKLRDLLNNENVQSLVSQIDVLPSLPSLYLEIIDKLNEPDASLSDVGAIISKDVSMSAKILKLVNSSFFGFFTKISNPEQAVSLLGLITIKSLVLSIKVFSQFDSEAEKYLSIEELWNHSFLTGLFTKAIVNELSNDKDLREDAFTVGLIHNIGIITLTTKLPDKYRSVYEHALGKQIALAQAEYEILGSSHSEIGGYLLGLWGFPDKITDAVARHHFINVDDENYDDLTLALHIADIFVQRLTNQNQNLPLENLNDIVSNDQRFIENSDKWFKICSDIFNGEIS